MKFESRILIKILVAFFIAWTLFLVFLYQNLLDGMMREFREQGNQSRQQMASIVSDVGASLLTLSDNISNLVFVSKREVKNISSEELGGRLTRSWDVFNKQFPLLTMNHYDKKFNLIGSWGVSSSLNRVYATPPSLLRAFEERVGVNYFTCQTICYYHASRALYPHSFEYGILHFSLPVDILLAKFNLLNLNTLTLMQRNGEGLNNQSIQMLNDDFQLQTTTRFLDFRAIQPLIGGIKKTNFPYLFKNNGKSYLLYAFAFPGSQDMVYVLSRDVSAQVLNLRSTFLQVMLGSFLVLSLMLGVLHFSLHQIISRLNKLVKVLPIIGEERFQDAADQLDAIAEASRSGDERDELGVLHLTTKGLNNKLQNLLQDYQKQNIKLRHLADHDVLTGLYNRRKFQELMEGLYASRQPFMLVNLDLDHFKLINDALGHAVGDHLLVLFADILRQYGNDSIIGRMGGDEFAMILTDMSQELAYARLHSITKQMSTIKLKETTADFLSCVPSIGVACYPENTGDLDELAAFADAAMYENKRRKQGVCIFYSGQEVILSEEKQFTKWINLIFHAIQYDQLLPHFQPIVSVDGQETVAFEALARMYNKKGGISVADNFISYAEQALAIIKLDYAMLDQILKRAGRLGTQPCLMINMSNLTLEHAGVGDYILNKLQEYSYDPSQIVFELTENYEIKDFVQFNLIMSQLRAVGVRFALDDFGMGYSSFNYISRLKFDFIKIDKSIINGLLSPESDNQVSSLHIVESIVHIAKKSNITTIAEGIESIELFDKVRWFQVDLLQGYLFGRPEAEFIEFERPPGRYVLPVCSSRCSY